MKRARCEDLYVYYKIDKIQTACSDMQYLCTIFDHNIFGIGSSESNAITDARRKLLDLICYEYFPEAGGRYKDEWACICITYTEIQTYIKKNKAFHVYSSF